MYSPKIREELIPVLYRLAKHKRMPMTKLVNHLLRESLAQYQIENQTQRKEVSHDQSHIELQQESTCCG